MPARPPFVDPHVHLWDLGRIRYPWLMPPFGDGGPNGRVEAIATNYGPEEYRAEVAGWTIAGIVHIEAGAHPDDAVHETRWLAAEAGRSGLPTAMVAHAALDEPGLDRILEAQRAEKRVHGIRQILNWHPDPNRNYTPHDRSTSDAWRQGFRRLRHYGFGFDLQAYPRQFPNLQPLFAENPDIPVVINHAGMLVPTDENGFDDWRRGMRLLAELPHVAVKISGMGFSFRPWTEAQIRPYVLEAIALFGADRAMFASDLPTDRLFGTCAATLGAYDRITAAFSASERFALFAGNANRIYRLGLPLEQPV